MPYRKKRNTCKKPRKRNTRGKPRKRNTRGKPRKRNTRMKTGVKSKIRTKEAGMWKCPARLKPRESKRTRKARRNRLQMERMSAALEDAETLAAEVLEAEGKLASAEGKLAEAERASLADKELVAAQARDLFALRSQQQDFAASSGQVPMAHVTSVQGIEAPPAYVTQLSGHAEAQRARNQRIKDLVLRPLQQPEPEPEPEPDLLAGDNSRIKRCRQRLGSRPSERKGRRKVFKVGDPITWYSKASERRIDGEVVSVNGDGTLDLQLHDDPGRRAGPMRGIKLSEVLHKA